MVIATGSALSLKVAEEPVAEEPAAICTVPADEQGSS